MFNVKQNTLTNKLCYKNTHREATKVLTIRLPVVFILLSFHSRHFIHIAFCSNCRNMTPNLIYASDSRVILLGTCLITARGKHVKVNLSMSSSKHAITCERGSHNWETKTCVLNVNN